jgi:hypothetical protein
MTPETSEARSADRAAATIHEVPAPIGDRDVESVRRLRQVR